LALLSSLYGNDFVGGAPHNNLGGVLGTYPHFPGKRPKRESIFFKVADLHKIETFDYKPELGQNGTEKGNTPIVQGTQRNSGMVSSQSTFPLVKSIYDFQKYGQSGAWVVRFFLITAAKWWMICVSLTHAYRCH